MAPNDLLICVVQHGEEAVQLLAHTVLDDLCGPEVEAFHFYFLLLPTAERAGDQLPRDPNPVTFDPVSYPKTTSIGI